MTSPTVLLIEDQEWTARSIESILRPVSFAVFKTYTGRQGLDVARKVNPDLVLVDRHLPDMSGRDVIDQLRKIPSIGVTTPMAVITSGAALPCGKAGHAPVRSLGRLHLPLRSGRAFPEGPDLDHGQERGRQGQRGQPGRPGYRLVQLRRTEPPGAGDRRRVPAL